MNHQTAICLRALQSLFHFPPSPSFLLSHPANVSHIVHFLIFFSPLPPHSSFLPPYNLSSPLFLCLFSCLPIPVLLLPPQVNHQLPDSSVFLLWGDDNPLNLFLPQSLTLVLSVFLHFIPFSPLSSLSLSLSLSCFCAHTHFFSLTWFCWILLEGLMLFTLAQLCTHTQIHTHTQIDAHKYLEKDRTTTQSSSEKAFQVRTYAYKSKYTDKYMCIHTVMSFWDYTFFLCFLFFLFECPQ